MDNKETIHKLEIMRNTCQKLIDEKVNLGRLVGTDVTETWKVETPFDDACQNLIEALTLAISAVEFKERYAKFWEEVKVAGRKGKEIEIHHSGRVFRIREVAQ